MGELRGIDSGPTLCEWDLEAIAATPFDTQRFQDRLFVAPSFGAMLRDVDDWLRAEEARLGAHKLEVQLRAPRERHRARLIERPKQRVS